MNGKTKELRPTRTRSIAWRSTIQLIISCQRTASYPIAPKPFVLPKGVDNLEARSEAVRKVCITKMDASTFSTPSSTNQRYPASNFNGLTSVGMLSSN